MFTLRNRNTALVILSCLLLAVAGCKPSARMGGPDAKALAAKEQQEQDASQGLTDAQCQEFGRQFVEWVRKGDADSIDRAVDYDRIVEQAAGGTGIHADEYQGLTQGARAGMRKSSLGKQLVSQKELGGKLSFLRVANRDGYKRAVFRQLPAGGGVNYQEMLLVPSGDRLHVVDIYLHASGELLSETLRHMLVPPTAPTSLPGEDVARHSEKLKQLARQVSAGEHDAAISTYESLPEVIRKIKLARVQYLMATSMADEKKHLQAIEDYRRDFPGEAAIDLLSIDSLIIAKRYDEAVAACARVDEAVGGDPYLDVICGNILVAAERLDEAAQRAGKAAADPEIVMDVVYLRASIALMKRDYDALVKQLSELESKHGVDMSGVTIADDYADFRESPQYERWLAKRKKESNQ